jgi:Asp-tRNA(Asn)/Glu-tRNA(Gln) amidotransferase B subunit
MLNTIITKKTMEAIKEELSNMNHIDMSILELKSSISDKAIEVLQSEVLDYAEQIEWYLKTLTRLFTNEMIRIENYQNEECYELAREKYKASNEELYTISGGHTNAFYTHVIANKEVVSYLNNNEVFNLIGTQIY